MDGYIGRKKENNTFLVFLNGFPSSRTFSSIGGTGYGKTPRLFREVKACWLGLKWSPVWVFLTLVCRAESELVLLSAVMGRCICWLLSTVLDQFLLQLGSGGGDG